MLFDTDLSKKIVWICLLRQGKQKQKPTNVTTSKYLKVFTATETFNKMKKAVY